MKKLILLVALYGQFVASAQNNSLPLDGKWAFRIDSSNAGLNEQWFLRGISDYPQTISLPGTMDDAGLGDKVIAPHGLVKATMMGLWRKVSYTGAAWYAKEIIIPSPWKAKRIQLSLERVIWESRVWIDGVEVNDMQESLSTPHIFDLSGLLAPGRHLLLIRIDNSKKYDISYGDNNFAHAYTNGTQIIWNGIIGKLQLSASDKVYISNVQVFANNDSNLVRVVTTIYDYRDNSKRRPERLQLQASYRQQQYAGTARDISLHYGKNEIAATYRIPAVVKQWSEFTPALYKMRVGLSSIPAGKSITTSFGFRTVSNRDASLQVNGQHIFLRGTLDCAIFPLTGHPPMDKKAWLSYFSVVKSYGLNHIRFHSWCPPEAAFSAADEMGFYLQIELPVWTLKIGKDSAADGFLKREAYRIIASYGNHPSFCFFSLGNEMQGDMTWLSKTVMELKSIDSRRLYTTTTFTFEEGYGKWPVPADDFFVTQYTKKGWVRGQGVFDEQTPSFDKNYNHATDSLPIPLIIHEMGQYAVFPRLKETVKYKGVLQPANFYAVKNDLQKKNLLALSDKYTASSGKFAALLYKEEIERALKTRGASGFQLLGLQDFPGQGTALVGVLDAFWQSKGVVTPEQFRQFCSPIVPLLDFEKASYLNTEPFIASLQIANYGSVKLTAPVSWQISNSQHRVIGHGTFHRQQIDIGTIRMRDIIKVDLTNIRVADKLTIDISINNTTIKNSWNIWVYPPVTMADHNPVVICQTYEEAIDNLKAGKKVLFNPIPQTIKGLSGKFVPVFWSPVHFPDQTGTMGLLVNPKLPAFSAFPTDAYSNWQWWDLCKHSTVMLLDSTGIDPSAILLRNIDNFFKNRQLASILECKVASGQLLLCSMDITTNLDQRHAARQLRASLIHYMNSAAFNPSATVGAAQLKRLLQKD